MVCLTSRGVTGKFFLRGQSNFSWSFSRWKISILVAPKQILVVFKSEKQKKKKRKGPLLIFELFPPSIFNFPPSLLQFFFFSSPFPPPPFSLFPSLFFPDRSAKIPRSEVSGRHSAPLRPPVMPLLTRNHCICLYTSPYPQVGHSFSTACKSLTLKKKI